MKKPKIVAPTRNNFAEWKNRNEKKNLQVLHSLQILLRLSPTPPADGDAYGIALGDHTTQNLVLNFNSEQAVTLQSTAFSADAEIKSFACRTGTGVLNSDDAEPLDPSGLPGGGGGFNWKTEVSQAQVMANAIRRVVWAYVCKSNYEDTWGTFLDRRRYDLCRLPDPAVPGGSG